MTWGRWYAAQSHVLSTLWLSPLLAFVLAQLTYRVPYVLGMHLGALPGFIYTEQGKISALEINITMNLTFIVFTFGSMLVAIQIASAQLSPRIIATTLLRDNVIRFIVGLFTYGLVISLGARNRTETIPNFIISIAALWGLISVVAFLFLIDYAARLLRPLSIVRRLAERGLKVFDDVYPEAAGSQPDLPFLRTDALPAGRTIAHTGKSGIILAVNVTALVAGRLTPKYVKDLAALFDSHRMPHDLHDPKYADPATIAASTSHIINHLVAGFIATLPAEEVYHAAQARGFTWGAVRAPEQLLEDAHLGDRGFWKQVEHPELGRSFTYPGEAAIYNGSPWRISRRAPLLGEHNVEIFCGELGLSRAELSVLAEGSAV